MAWRRFPRAPRCHQRSPVNDVSAVLSKLGSVAPLLSRIVAAMFGGYALAALTSIATLAIPMKTSEAVFAGLLSSIVVYALAVIWVFAVRTATRAWAGLLVVALPLLVVVWATGIWSGGT